jgi:hypothetical protein
VSELESWARAKEASAETSNINATVARDRFIRVSFVNWLLTVSRGRPKRAVLVDGVNRVLPAGDSPGKRDITTPQF